MLSLVWTIPLWPLAGFLLNGFFGRKWGKGPAGVVACASVLASFVIALGSFFALLNFLMYTHGVSRSQCRKRTLRCISSHECQIITVPLIASSVGVGGMVFIGMAVIVGVEVASTSG